MSMLHRSFKPAKCKTSLKLAVSRIKLLNNKRETQVKQMKRELAQLLESGQVQTARIRVEHVIREEKTLMAYNFIEVFCELIATRLPIIESQKNCPIDLKEAISSVIFASPRCADVPELTDIRKHFTAKYGKEFVSAAIELRPDCGVNRTVVEKLSAKASDGQTKIKVLSAIAEEHNVKWNPDAFGGHDSNPPKDLLSGPNNFEMASKVHTETSPGSARNQDDEGPLNVQVPHKHDQRHDVLVNLNEQNLRPTSGYQNYASTDVAPNQATTSGPFHPEVRYSGPGTERMDHKQSGSGNENSYSVGRQNWNVQFKDATSAAQAAAESAELASMAARAAAELSRQYSSESQKSYGYVQKDEEPQIYADSKLQSDHIAKQAENNAFHGRSSGLHDKNIVDNEREELSGAAERFHREGYKKNDGYNNAASLKSSSVSTDDDATLVNSFQTVDRYPQRKSSESDKRDLLDEVNKKKHSGEFELPSEEIAYFDKNVTSKQSKGVSSHSHSSCFSDDKEDVLRKDDNISYFEDTKTQKQSSGPSAQSHLSTFSDIHEDILKRNDPSENLFVDNDRSIYRKVSEINSSDNTALFDDYGSDDGNYNFDVGDYKEQETSFSFSSPSRNSSKNLFADSTVWSPRRNTDEGLTKSTSQLHLPVYPESSKGTRFPSRQEDLPPAAFDDYDSPSSDGEEVLGKSKLHGSADFDKFPSEKNLSAEFDKSPYEKNLRADFDKSPSEKDLNLNSPEPMQSEDHILGSSSSDAGNVGSRRNPWVPTTSVDPQPKEVHPDRSQGITSSSVSEKKFDYAEPGQLPPRFMKSVKDTPDFLDTTKDTELLEESTFESSPELKFGTLTGGLRNKGSRRPPYFRKSSQNSLSVEQETKDTFTNIEQSSSSPTMRTAIGSGAGSQEPDIEKENANLNSKIDRRTFVNFHDDDLEEELPQETSSSRQPYNQRLGIELNKKSNSRASHTYFDLDNSDSEEELPKLTSSRNARLGAGFSRRTKGSSSNSGRSYSKTTVLSGESRTPEYGADSNSSSSSSHAGEILPKPLSETKSSDHSVEEHTPQPIPESRRSSHTESLKSSTREQKSNPHTASIEQDTPKSIPKSRRSSRLETQKSPTRERTSSSLRFSVKQDWILPKPLSETKSSDHSVEEHTPQPIPESRRSSRMESLKSSTGEQKSNPHPASIEQDIPKSMPESRRPSRMETQKSPTRERTSSSLRSSVKQDTPNATPESRRSSRMENQKSPTREQTSSSLRLSAKQDTPEPILESRRSSPKESLKLSTREQTSKSLPKVVTSGVTEASKSPVGTPDTASKDKTTHVHPKLPDSDAFTAFFHSLRQTRE